MDLLNACLTELSSSLRRELKNNKFVGEIIDHDLKSGLD